MLVKIKTLNKIFKDKYNGTSIVIEGKCQACGENIQIVIEQTSGGFGFLGGVLYEPISNQISMMCENCFNVNPHLNESYNLDVACCQSVFQILKIREILKKRNSFKSADA
jgi:hypothetical protein